MRFVEELSFILVKTLTYFPFVIFCSKSFTGFLDCISDDLFIYIVEE